MGSVTILTEKEQLLTNKLYKYKLDIANLISKNAKLEAENKLLKLITEGETK